MLIKWEGYWDFVHVRKGKVIYEARMVKNALVDQGEQLILDTIFRNQAITSQFFVGLANDVISETDGLSDIAGEPGGNGYARQALNRDLTDWPILVLHEGDYRTESKEVVFAASGGSIGPINSAFLSTTLNNTGKLVAFITLPLVRTILDGDEGFVKVRIKIK